MVNEVLGVCFRGFRGFRTLTLNTQNQQICLRQKSKERENRIRSRYRTLTVYARARPIPAPGNGGARPTPERACDKRASLGQVRVVMSSLRGKKIIAEWYFREPAPTYLNSVFGVNGLNVVETTRSPLVREHLVG